MKSYKLIAALLLIPTLVLAGFSAAVLAMPKQTASAAVAAGLLPVANASDGPLFKILSSKSMPTSIPRSLTSR